MIINTIREGKKNCYMYIFSFGSSGIFWLHTLIVCKDEQSHPLVCKFPFGSLEVGFYIAGTIASGPF